MEHEIWKPVKGYEGLYEVSNLGRIRKGTYIMKPIIHVSGYHMIGLSLNRRQRIFRLHRIIAFHFCDKKEGYDIVNHLNGIKTDNRAENLEWTNSLGNVRHAFENNLRNNKGQKNPYSFLKETDILKIKSLNKIGESIKSLSISFNVSKSTIEKILNGKRWQHIK